MSRDPAFALRLLESELAALQTDWAQVAGPAPGHDFRRAVVRARDMLAAARSDLAAGRGLPPGWDDRIRVHLRAARRVLVRRQLAHYAPWWPPERRYLA